FDGYLAKLDTAGIAERIIPLFSPNGSVLPNRLSWFEDGILVAGDFSGTVDLITDQLITTNNVFNLFIAYLRELTSSSSTFLVLEKAVIVPNPTQGLFTIEGLTESYELQATDRQGKVIFPLQKVSGPIDCSAWANGLYFLSIRTENGQKTGILVKND
ncbi:MAG: T9SS type A sorting domain-containing protein, partial [Bacteroidota bacterium]